MASKCPHCGYEVSVPEGGDDRVRCPACRGMFSLLYFDKSRRPAAIPASYAELAELWASAVGWVSRRRFVIELGVCAAAVLASLAVLALPSGWLSRLRLWPFHIKTPSAAALERDPSDASAIKLCQALVVGKLKNEIRHPADAAFPWGGVKVENLTHGRIRIKSYVEYRTASGAFARRDFVCLMRFEGGRWITDSLNFQSEE